MSKIEIHVKCDFTEGELKDFCKEVFTRAEERILSVIRKKDAGAGVLKQTISRYAGHGSGDAKSREAILQQLIEEGIIEIVSGGNKEHGKRYRIAKQ